MEEERKKNETVHVDEERSAFQSIDWFDFTVVETIDFADDELYEQPGASKHMAVVHEEDDDMDTDMDEDDDHKITQGAMIPPPPTMASMNNSYQHPIPSSSSAMDVTYSAPNGSQNDASKYGGGGDNLAVGRGQVEEVQFAREAPLGHGGGARRVAGQC